MSVFSWTVGDIRYLINVDACLFSCQQPPSGRKRHTLA